MKSEELKSGIYWVGAIDWAIRDFHDMKLLGVQAIITT